LYKLHKQLHKSLDNAKLFFINQLHVHEKYSARRNHQELFKTHLPDWIPRGSLFPDLAGQRNQLNMVCRSFSYGRFSGVAERVDFCLQRCLLYL